MAGKRDAAETKRLESMSTERRKLIGQAIIDGLLAPGAAALIDLASDPDYNQGQGDYTQRGGDHQQGGGGYNQAPAMNIRNAIDPVVLELRSASVIRE